MPCKRPLELGRQQGDGGTIGNRKTNLGLFFFVIGDKELVEKDIFGFI